MTTRNLLDRVFVPIASKADARATARALLPYVRETHGHVIVGHVIEKAGGAPDKASVAQRERRAEAMFAIVDEVLTPEHVPHEFHVLFGTDVADRIIAAADEHDADAIVFTPRGGSRWIRLLTGDVSHDLVANTDRPVLVLPDVGEDDRDGVSV